jgi:peptidyl-prolyl cis-trans isomerase A (cyclophilin A)
MLRTSLATLAIGVAASVAVTATASAAPPAALLKPAALKAKAPAVYTVAFTTTKGRFEVRVQRSLAPRGADRFYNLVRARFYDGVKFFRVLPGFVVQFGISGYPAVSSAWESTQIPDDPVKGSNTRGTITFANAGANTRTTQVFINYGANTNLDALGFAPFGKVTKGMNVVGKLYGAYGEAASDMQSEIEAQGNAFLKREFPKLDAVITARVV